MVRLPFSCCTLSPRSPAPLYRQIQYSDDESKALRSVTNEVHVYNPSDWSAGIVDKVRLEGVTSVSLSPGRNPNVAMFVAEKKVRPAPSCTPLDRLLNVLSLIRAHRLPSRFTLSSLSARWHPRRPSTRLTRSR